VPEVIIMKENIVYMAYVSATGFWGIVKISGDFTITDIGLFF
jgi:hypothetical protein